MNQKKCPKCGEMNPPEAVMCWACYTPLTGAAVASAGMAGAVAGVPGMAGAATAGGRPGTAVGPPVEEGEKQKTAIAPWQMGVLAVALLLAIGFGAKTMFGGSAESLPSDVPTAQVDTQPAVDPAPVSVAPASAPPPPAGPPVADSTVQEVRKLPYTIILQPNPDQKRGTMAIVATQPNLTAQQAANIARVTRANMTNAARWQPLHIYVMADVPSAQQFNAFQVKRNGAPLGSADYQGLSALWPKVLVRYELNRGRETIAYPSSNPTNWWTRSR